MKEPTPPAVSPAWWTSSRLCPITVIRECVDTTRGTTEWLVIFLRWYGKSTFSRKPCLGRCRGWLRLEWRARGADFAHRLDRCPARAGLRLHLRSGGQAGLDRPLRQ